MSEKESIWEKLDSVPNPVFYGIILILVSAVLIRPIGIPIVISEDMKRWHKIIEEIPENSLIYVDIEMLPSSAGELEPFLTPLCHHIFSKDFKLVFFTLVEDGYFMYMKYVEEGINPQQAYGKVYGKDYIFLGYLAGTVALQSSMAQDLFYPRVDYLGTPLTEFEILDGVKDIYDIDIFLDVNGAHGGSGVEQWVIQWVEPYGIRYLAAATSMTVTTYLPYYEAGQIEILVSASSAAAEYEYIIGKPGRGLLASDALSLSQMLVVLFMILGNISYSVKRRKGRKT